MTPGPDTGDRRGGTSPAERPSTAHSPAHADPPRVLGMGLAGPGAGELIAEGVLAVEMGACVDDIKLSIHPHPTLSETVMESAEVFFGHSPHFMGGRK